METDLETSMRLGRVRQSKTKPEVIVARILGKLGHRYRTRNHDLFGSPDLANRKRRWAIFVHGCFWHGHRGCVRATVPKRNRDFWIEKFAGNRARDRSAARALKRSGYRVLTLWECEVLANAGAIRTLLASALSLPRSQAITPGRRTRAGGCA